MTLNHSLQIVVAIGNKMFIGKKSKICSSQAEFFLHTFLHTYIFFVHFKCTITCNSQNKLNKQFFISLKVL